jgi:hypothetical protein
MGLPISGSGGSQLLHDPMDRLLLKVLIVIVALTLFVNVYFILNLDDKKVREEYLGSIDFGGESVPVSNKAPIITGHGNGNGDDGDSGSDSNPSGTIAGRSTSDCYSRFGMSSNTIVFYYESNETHSINMKSVVDSMDPGRFYPMTQLWNASFNQCFDLRGIVPSFVCAGTKSKVSGEMNRSALETFMNSC